MYKLNQLDKFNIKNLLSLRWDWKSKIDLQKAIDAFFQMESMELASYIDNILRAWEKNLFIEITWKDQKIFNYCEELVERLVSSEDWEETEWIEEEVIRIKDLENIHPDIYSHIHKFYNDWHYATAVEESYKITRRKLIELTGKEKWHEAFKEWNYEILFWKVPKTEAEKNFCEWVKFLHLSIQNFRNEKAHTPAKELDKNRAIHYIYLASLALDLIDNKKN